MAMATKTAKAARTTKTVKTPKTILTITTDLRISVQKTLEQIQLEIGDCRRCELCETRTTIVFGVGNPDAEVMFIGEAPGQKEDLGAEPFIGAAGKYLNELLGYAKLTREEVYIANVLKCRPPGNADPLPHQIEVCTPFLRDQVRAISPLVLVTLGRFATQFILKTDVGISHLRGKITIAGRFSVLPIFHPAAAIYDQSKKPILQADFELLGKLIAKRHKELGI
jgi:DNA polymerase